MVIYNAIGIFPKFLWICSGVDSRMEETSFYKQHDPITVSPHSDDPDKTTTTRNCEEYFVSFLSQEKQAKMLGWKPNKKDYLPSLLDGDPTHFNALKAWDIRS